MSTWLQSSVKLAHRSAVVFYMLDNIGHDDALTLGNSYLRQVLFQRLKEKRGFWVVAHHFGKPRCQMGRELDDIKSFDVVDKRRGDGPNSDTGVYGVTF